MLSHDLLCAKEEVIKNCPQFLMCSPTLLLLEGKNQPTNKNVQLDQSCVKLSA